MPSDRMLNKYGRGSEAAGGIFGVYRQGLPLGSNGKHFKYALQSGASRELWHTGIPDYLWKAFWRYLYEGCRYIRKLETQPRGVPEEGIDGFPADDLRHYDGIHRTGNPCREVPAA